MIRVLCVCTGNTCRSPMLAALLAAALQRRGIAALVESAGVAAWPGEPASEGAQRALARRGLDLSGHRSQPLAGLDLARYARIYAVSPRHAAFLRAQGVEPARLAVVAAEHGGVPDPYGGDDEAYEEIAALLAAEAEAIAEELRSLQPPPADAPPAGG
ncbi:MAG: low molecular weight protein arginine phosphatase [Planctomycetota bacterium]|nr:low molecular weight protein arginine phosphatase [Planctomycetota bacterium]MCX8039336.1 low molecular weight protein arginine phosphatase [Planctomycetota bacterium]MDW8373627.1 low molecular weight protein arginine phosphatase [Planctomycetota bacterium]